MLRIGEIQITLMLKKDYQDIENKSLEDIKENIDERMEQHETGEVSFNEPESGNSPITILLIEGAMPCQNRL